jgi:hypothetical protein
MSILGFLIRRIKEDQYRLGTVLSWKWKAHDKNDTKVRRYGDADNRERRNDREGNYSLFVG